MTAELRDADRAPGIDQVEAHCATCHSLDYVRMNSMFLSPAAWDAEVAKMINIFCAPISSSDANAVANYLKENYAK